MDPKRRFKRYLEPDNHKDQREGYDAKGKECRAIVGRRKAVVEPATGAFVVQLQPFAEHCAMSAARAQAFGTAMENPLPLRLRMRVLICHVDRPPSVARLTDRPYAQWMHTLSNQFSLSGHAIGRMGAINRPPGLPYARRAAQVGREANLSPTGNQL